MLPRFSILAAALVTLALAAPPLAQPADMRLVPGGPVTQTVELAAGPNLVSLYVVPDDLSMAAIAAGLGGNLRSVKDPNTAAVYVPTEGIRDLTSWDWRTAYVVDVKEVSTLRVSGRRIDPASPVLLREGWNFVPYLHDRALPADSAFGSLADGTDWAGFASEAAGGATSAPAGSALMPGRGYRVYAYRQDTLAYAGPELSPPVETDRTVDTIAEALALSGLRPGETVRVRGYYAPGDGGGGVFDVTESGQAPDGGTVFAPLEHQSGEVEDEVSYNRVSVIPSVPEGEDVVFGSLTLHVESPDGRELLVPPHLLHGHRHAARWSVQPMITYEGGIFRDPNTIRRFLGQNRGRLTFRYRYTTSSLRLERRDVGSTLDAHWFGARPAASGPNWTGSTDVQPILAHMGNVATAMNEGAPSTITDLLLPALDVYDYFGSIDLTDGLMLRGAAGTHVVQVTNDLGHTYRPVRVRPAHTRLRVMDGEALKHVRMNKDEGDPHYLAPDAKYLLDNRPTSIAPAHGAMSAGVADLVLDGNWEGNREAWTEGWGSHDDFERNLRNTPGWAGFVATNHGGKDIPQGQRLTVRNVAVLGYGSNGLLGHANNTWTVENFLGGNSLWNHVVYNANGDYTNLTLTGFAWGHAAWGYGTISNFVYEDGAPGPERQGTEVMGIRGGDAYDSDELAGVDGYFTRSDGTVPEGLGTEIVGFYLDMRGSGMVSALKGLGPNITIRGVSSDDPARLIADPEVNANALFHEAGNGYQDALYPNYRIEHVVVHDLHVGDAHRQSLIGNFNATDAVVRNVRIERPTNSANRTLTIAANRRDHWAWDLPQVQLYEQIRDESTEFIARVTSARPDAAGMDVFVRDSKFGNRSNTLYAGNSGTGELSRFDGDPSKLRVYMNEVTFNLTGSYFQNLELFFATTRFRDCTDGRSGRTSESSRTLQASDFGGRETIVPLGLFWAPQSRDYVEFGGAGASAVQSWEIVDAEGRPLGEDQRDPHIRIRLSESLGGRALTVDAAVRPWEDGVNVPVSLLE